MKAVQITAKEQVRVIDMPTPAAATGTVLLKIEYVGFCGSDLNTYRGLNPLVKLPVIPGHEIGAVIKEVGPGVPDFLKPGMTVTVNPYTACGHCPACANGRHNACQHNETFGVQRDGAMTDLLAVPWEKVIPCEGVSPRDAALIEPMSVGFHAVNRGAVTDSDTVMVTGCGMIGVGAIVRAALRGATVIAVDVDDDKLALARSLGAAHTINSAKEDVLQAVAAITDGRGADVVIEAVGRPETYVQAINVAAFTGRVVYIGYAKQPVSFDTSLFVKKELDIRGSRNATPADFKAVIGYMRRGTCPADALISGVFPPEQAHEALRRWCEAPARVFRILINF